MKTENTPESKASGTVPAVVCNTWLGSVLCYVDAPWAYFTTRRLSEQWGDDWDDAPYEHNAGTP